MSDAHEAAHANARNNIRRARVRHLLRAALIIGLSIGLAWASTRHRLVLDWTATSRHTLGPASVGVLAALDAPVSVTAYVPDQPALRGRVREFFARYQQHKADLELRLVDPHDIPDLVRAEGLHDGEVVLRLGGKTEVVREYSERAVTNALARLARSRDRWVAFVTGHGERHPNGAANHDISGWVKTLTDRGLQRGLLNLAESAAVPDNTSVLVIASPRVAYLPGELEMIEKYVDAGGNLLWLTEPDAPASMDRLAMAVGVEKIPGTVVDPLTQALGIDNPAIAVVTAYGEHPAVAGFAVATLLPYAAALHDRARAGWTATRLFMSGAKAWSETAALSGNVAFDAGQDYAGPLPLAVALYRSMDVPGKARRDQRVVVVGDGDFLANTYVDNSGNRDLGVRLVEWLVAEDALIAVPASNAPDRALELSKWQGAIISIGFLFLLPLALAANGILIWWRRRRA